MADQDLTFRRALEEDIEDIKALEEGAIIHPWTEGAIRNLINNKNNICLVIELDNKIVCYVGAETVLDECNIGNIVTHKDFRDMGLGTGLFSRLMEELALMKIRKVFLEVEVDNAPAIALYEKAGFERYGQRRDYYGPGKDAVLMTKEL